MEHAKDIRDFVVANFLFGNASKLRDEHSFLESGIIDSTGILELVLHLETTYSITIQNHEMLPENLDSVARAADFVARKRAAAASPVFPDAAAAKIAG